jgi:DNA repair photolyase
VVNPYVGCGFGCQYCYAAFIGRWKHPNEPWGSFVDAKVNAPEILQKELQKLADKTKGRDFGTIFFSSVTDPYQGAEAKFKITRGCLEVLAEFGYEGEVSILTKSPLVWRDVDILKRFKNAAAGLTITSTSDDVSRFLENNAPPVLARIGALEKLNAAGIKTYAFVGPLLPYFTARPDKLEKLFEMLRDCGVKDIYIEHINLSAKIRERLFEYLAKAPDLIPYFEDARKSKYRHDLEKIIYPLARKYGLEIIGGKVLLHGKR